MDEHGPFRALSGILWILLLSRVERIGAAEGAGGVWCGLPGAPAHGRALPSSKTRFRPGEVASFSCEAGFALQGAPRNRICTEEGTWSGHIPFCERPLPSDQLVASSRASLSLYPAQRATDGDPASCAYTEKQRPRWVRLDMGGRERRVTAVAITVPPGMYRHDAAHLTVYAISVRDSSTASYHKCATFAGRFASPTLRLQCSGGGVEGRYVHVEDERRTTDYFGLCEIHVYAHQGGSYECGEAERPLHAYSVRTAEGAVQVRCLHGYRLQGPAERVCGEDGRWHPLQQPLCEEIVCPSLPPVSHGRLSYSGGIGGRPTLGAVAVLTCDHGFEAEPTEGDNVCGEDGRWRPLAARKECTPVECGPPSPRGPFDVVLLNGTRLGGVAMLSCPIPHSLDGKEAELIHCREDGRWSTPTTQCSPPPHSGLSRLGWIEEEQGDVSTGVVIGMGVAVLLLLLAVILALLVKRRKVLRQRSADSLPHKQSSDPPPAYDNNAFYVAPNDSSKPRNSSLFSTVLFPSQWRRRKSGSSPNDSTHCSGQNDSFPVDSAHSSSSSGLGVYEEVGRALGGDTEKVGVVSAAPVTESEAVYAQVDLDEKRRSRMNRVERFEPVDPPEWEGTYRSEGAYDEVDLEPIKLRELPPVPHPSEEGATYASLSFPLDPPLMKDNELYHASDGLKV